MTDNQFDASPSWQFWRRLNWLKAKQNSPARDNNKARSRRQGKKIAKLLLLAAPTLIAIIYFGFWAAPRYVSETQFVVRGANTTRLSGLEALFRTFGIARAVDDANIVQQYMLSRDAVKALESREPLRQIFSRPEGDVLARFPRFWENQSGEGLFDHYLARVRVKQDTHRGVAVLQTETFRAADSRRLAEALMRIAEDMVNTINERALNDAVGYAQQEVAGAERRLIDAQIALTKFRNEAALVDPTKNSATTLETISALSNDLSMTLAEIQHILRTAPASPALPGAKARVEALRARIDTERTGLAGDDSALAAKVSTYERLALVRDLADKGLASALLSLESARQEARRQQIYIERVSGPDMTDIPLEPRRLRSIFTVLVVSLMAYAVIWILSVGAREHGQRPGA